MNKALTVKTGQTHMQHYMRPLLQKLLFNAADFDMNTRLVLGGGPCAVAAHCGGDGLGTGFHIGLKSAPASRGSVCRVRARFRCRGGGPVGHRDGAVHQFGNYSG